MNRRVLTGFRLVVMVLLLLAVPAPPVPAQPARTVTVGVVRDGTLAGDRFLEQLQAELPSHLPAGVTVRFKEDPAFDAGVDLAAMRPVLEAALADPETDYLLLTGPYVTREAAQPDLELTKPVVSSFVHRADLVDLPYTADGRSAKPNLTFILIPRSAEQDLRDFRELVPFSAVHVAMSPGDMQYVWGERNTMARIEKDLGFELVKVAVTPEITDSMAMFGESVQAVYLSYLRNLSPEQRNRLIAELNKRKIPTFSMTGYPDVEAGALAAAAPDRTHQAVRRVALNLGRLIRGGSTSDLPVLMSADSRLLINGKTAAAIGYRPDPETFIFANFLHQEMLEGEADALEFSRLVSLVEEGNKLLAVKDAQVESVAADRDTARSALLPQLQAGLQYTYADNAIPDVFNGALDKDTAQAGISLRQLIWDQEVRAGVRSAGELTDAAALERDSVRLDAIAAAGTAFYNLGMAQELFRIAVDDVHLTESFLEVARLRQDVGYSGKEEVYRWEATLADRRGLLFDSRSNLETARIGLNQLLGLDQEHRWVVEIPEIEPASFLFIGSEFGAIVNDTASVQALRTAFIEVALENEPALQAADSTVAAQAIQLESRKKRYFVPSVFADLSWASQFVGDGNLLPSDDDNFYAVTVGASYPLFEGGRRKSEVNRAAADLKALERNRDLLREQVEQGTRSALWACQNSFLRIRFSREAAEAAGRNLDLVREQYAEGIVNVTDLLSAQNQKFTSDQVAAVNLHEFLIDLVSFQRAIAWFEADHGPEEREQMIARLTALMSEESQ